MRRPRARANSLVVTRRGVVMSGPYALAEVPGGGFAMGEAVDEAEARRMIEQAPGPGQSPRVGDVERAAGAVALDPASGVTARTRALDSPGPGVRPRRQGHSG